MIKGSFFNKSIPMVQATIIWGPLIQDPFFVLDTGFTGDLQVTPKIAKELGLKIDNIIEAKIATGQLVTVPTASAIASMEGVTNFVQVIISNSMPLMGISFLEKFKYKAIIDCKLKTVLLDVSV
jgi:predicted aspartyl protease